MMKYIITESQEIKIRLLRRLEAIDDAIPFKMHEVLKFYHVCKDSVDVFIDVISGEISHDLYYVYFSDIEDDSKEWGMVCKMINKYIKDKFNDRITDFYNSQCDKKNITESRDFYLRRLPEIDKLIESSLLMFNDWENPKVNIDYMIRFLSVDVSEQYFFRNYEDSEVLSEKFNEFHDFIESYLKSKWRNKINSILKSHRKK